MNEIETISKKIANNHVANIITLNSTDFVVSFSYYKEERLFVSLNHNNPKFVMIKDDIDIPSELNKLNEFLKQKVKSQCIKKIKQINNDSIIEIELEKANELFEIERSTLVLELIPRKANILLIKNSKISYVYRPTDITSKRPLCIGLEYNTPPKDDCRINSDIFVYEKDLFENSKRERIKEKYNSLQKEINAKIKRANKKENVLNEETENATKQLKYVEFANNLLSFSNDNAQIKEYIKANDIPYDNSKKLMDNINGLFKKYKKAKATIKYNEIELNKNKDELIKLNNDYEIVSSLNEDNILSLANKYPSYFKNIKRDKIIKAYKPFFVIIDGVKYGYGKNAEQNQHLTFTIATKQDYFFHINGYSGAHVIVFKKKLEDKEIQIASQLAIYLSKKDIGVVDYCSMKDTKRGSKTGEVIISNSKQYQVKQIDRRIIDSISQSIRFI